MKKVNILIIEDTTLTAQKMKRTLQWAGYYVVAIANRSETALEVMFKDHVDIIIADINIKGELNGIETAKLIQKNFNVPVIFLTSYHDDNTLSDASSVNFTGYIVKPYLDAHLLREVKLASFRFGLNNKLEPIELNNGYIYDIQNKVLLKNNEAINLTKKEEQFLHILIQNKNQVVTNEYVDLVVWHEYSTYDENRRQLLFRLRKKIPDLEIQTIKGEGYILKV
ncbi:MAG: response regulator [Arcobacteraceae bacterium]|nr:response regulator [Arcobacteraceae bacterium]